MVVHCVVGSETASDCHCTQNQDIHGHVRYMYVIVTMGHHLQNCKIIVLHVTSILVYQIISFCL